MLEVIHLQRDSLQQFSFNLRLMQFLTIESQLDLQIHIVAIKPRVRLSLKSELYPVIKDQRLIWIITCLT